MTPGGREQGVFSVHLKTLSDGSGDRSVLVLVADGSMWLVC